jgi:hypothetical protein
MGRAEVDFIFYQSASLEPSRQQFKGFFDGFENIREDNRVDWEKLKGLYPCTLPHEALQFELHNVKVDPSTREEYKSFLNSCMVPADTTLTGQWLEGGTTMRGALTLEGSSCLAFESLKTPSIVIVQKMMTILGAQSSRPSTASLPGGGPRHQETSPRYSYQHLISTRAPSCLTGHWPISTTHGSSLDGTC